MNQKVGITLTAEDKTLAAFNSVQNSLGALKTRSDSLFSGLSGGLAGGLAAGLLGAGFSAYISGAIDSLDKLDEAAERLGMSTENLSALAYAGKMTGLEFEDMTGAITKLSVKMQEAASGSAEAAALFKDVGVKVKDANGNLKPAEVLLAEIAERFTAFEDGAGKTALAVDLFGKSGAKLVPLLNGGASGLEKMRKEAEALGGIIDSKLAKQAADYNDNLDRLATLSDAAAKSIAAQLLPSLNDTASAFLEASKQGKTFEAIVRGLAGIGKLPFDLLFGDSSPDVSKNARLTELNAEIATLERKIKDGKNGGLIGKLVYGDQAELKQKLDVARNQLAAIEKFGDKIFNHAKPAPEAAGGNETVVRTPSGDPKPKGRKSTEVAQASAEATTYAKAMEQLANLSRDADAAQLDLTKSQKALYDLMTSAEWSDMPDAWRQTAVAQFEQARASEEAADAVERLNKLLASTDSSKLEESRADMQLLAAALEKGAIAEEKYLEAVNKRLNDGNDVIKEQKTLVEDLGLTFSSAFEDAIVGGKNLQDVLKALLQDIAKVILRKNVTEPLLNSAKGFDWSSIGSSIASFFTANADGGVYRSPSLSAYSGKVYDSPQFFAFASGAGVFAEAGPEAIMPLRRGRDGKLGVAASGGGGEVSLIQNFYISSNGAADSTETSGSDSGMVKQFSERMAGVAKMVIVQEMRPGGMLQGVRA